MKHINHAPVVLFSLSQRAAIADLYNLCAEGTLKRCNGAYKGKEEPSWLMDADEFYRLRLPELLAADNQESILYLDNQRSAWLLEGPEYAKDSANRAYLGRWTEVGEAQARKCDAWTHRNGRYWIVR